MPTYTSHICNNDFTVDISSEGLICNTRPVDADLIKNNNIYLIRVDSKVCNIYIKQIAELTYEIWVKHYVITLKLETELTKRIDQFSPKGSLHTQSLHVKAPMPGLIKAVEVKEGQHVEPGAGLIILEAMKMENEILAAISGIVKKINVEKHNTVEKNQLLLIIEPSQNE